MSSGDPPSPNRRVKAKPSLRDASVPMASGEVAVPAANRPAPSKVDTSIAGDPKNSTQPASQVSPAPKLETLGRYTIQGELGRGGMGVVYLAEDTVLKRKVALKIPHFEPQKQEQMRDRFIREAQLAAQLTHRNICQVYDVSVIDDQLVMAMEYIDGRDLTVFTKSDKLLNARSAVSLIKKIAQAIDVAHKKGLIHRDLKPSNIMLAQSDTTNKMIEPKVMDFGLAKSLESTGKQLTHSGMIVGTPCYMSKEQWSGTDGNLGPASDVFSLGVILYELLTGQLPYEEDKGEPATAWFVKLVTKEQIRPSVRKPGLDADLDSIVMKSIAKEVADRYATMADFVAALDGWLKGRASSIVPGDSAARSQYEASFDFSEIATLVAQPPVTAKLPRKPPNSIPTKLKRAFGGAAALLLGIVLIYINSKGEKFIAESDSPKVSITTPDGMISATTSSQSDGSNPASEPLPSVENEADFSVFEGTWRVVFRSGYVHTYEIERNGSVVMIEGLHRRNLKLKRASTGVVLDIETWAVERFSVFDNELHVEHWNPRSELDQGKPAGDVGRATREASPASDAIIGRKAGDTREITLPGAVKLKQLWCPPGSFTMGSEPHVGMPSQVDVTLTQGFWLGQTEVTQSQWTAVMKSDPWIQHGDTNMYRIGSDFPAVYMDYSDAAGFCDKLTMIERAAGRLPKKWKYALPTEAQWQYACRAGTQTTFCFGNTEDQLSDYAWHVGNSAEVGELYAHTAATKQPNSWGFYDMHGNMEEWCSDAYSEFIPGGKDPYTAQSANGERVFLGGGWFSYGVYCHSAFRSHNQPTFRLFYTGFRVALVADASSELATTPVPADEATTSFSAGERRVFTSQSIPFRWCPAGTFTRGEGGTGPEATLTHGLWMGETEVTMEQWKTLMQNAPWVAAKREAMDEPNNPAVWISYTDVLAYCEKMTTAERAAGRLPVGWKYTLPTGAQWEYACRAGTSTRFSFGDDGSQLGEYGWYSKNAKDKGEWYGHAVAQKKPNQWGLYDMHGNVWEWCLDWHHDTLPGGQDPVDSVSGNDRVFWGGGWYYEDWSCTSFSRLGYPPHGLNPHIGFRMAIVKE